MPLNLLKQYKQLATALLSLKAKFTRLLSTILFHSKKTTLKMCSNFYFDYVVEEIILCNHISDIVAIKSNGFKKSTTNTSKVSVFGVFLIRIFPYLD